jgi:hypothetical protein
MIFVFAGLLLFRNSNAQPALNKSLQASEQAWNWLAMRLSLRGKNTTFPEGGGDDG